MVLARPDERGTCLWGWWDIKIQLLTNWIHHTFVQRPAFTSCSLNYQPILSVRLFYDRYADEIALIHKQFPAEPFKFLEPRYGPGILFSYYLKLRFLPLNFHVSGPKVWTSEYLKLRGVFLPLNFEMFGTKVCTWKPMDFLTKMCNS